ncbi:MAG: DNA primase [Desulfosalsimonadaceae bacterium]
MTIHIPEEKLAEIRNAADIVDIIAERVALKKAGRDYTGLCPFHSEKTPSFTVSPTKQIFHCFGCGAGGDVFNFLMKSDGISFPEAVQAVARRCGIELPARRMSSSEYQGDSERERLFAINKKVLAYYREQLLRQPAGEYARRYLEQRGFSQEIIKQFALGYAPEGWDNLVRFCRKEKIPDAMAEKAGLIIPRKSNTGYYDRFRSRIIFPIVDASRRVVGFGGRVLDDGKPKYLNSPETPVYNKSRTLYGLHAAKEQCRQSGVVYIVEGYFDLLAMHQQGIANAVATLGTSLTTAHVRMLKRGYAQKARLVFDSDTAGIKAAQRSIGLFRNEAMDVEIIVLPEGEDPDSFLFAHGRDAFMEKAAAARDAMEFLLDSSVEQYGLSMQGKIRIVDDLKQPLAEIRDHVARSVYLRHLAERLGIEEQAVLERVNTARRDKEKRLQKGRGAYSAGSEPGGAPAEDRPEIRPETRLETRVIAMMLQYPAAVSHVESRDVTDYFGDEQLKEIAELIISHPPQQPADISGLLNRLQDENQRRLLASLAISEECWDQNSCNQLLQQFLTTRKRRHQSLLEQIRAAEQSNDQQRLFELLKKKQKQVAKSE